MQVSSEAEQVTKQTRDSLRRLPLNKISCLQSFINIIDAVLLPPNGTQAAPLPISAGNIAASFASAPVQVGG